MKHITHRLLIMLFMLMMACAFGGYETVMQAYKVAIEEKYQFGCYGDAMLILD